MFLFPRVVDAGSGLAAGSFGTEGGAAGQKSCVWVGCVCMSCLGSATLAGHSVPWSRWGVRAWLDSVILKVSSNLFILSILWIPQQQPCATKACPPSEALCTPGLDGHCWVTVGFYFSLYFSCKPKLEVCDMADLMLRDNFGQLSVGPETLGEVWEVLPKKQSPVRHCKILRMDQIKW